MISKVMAFEYYFLTISVLGVFWYPAPRVEAGRYCDGTLQAGALDRFFHKT